MRIAYIQYDVIHKNPLKNIETLLGFINENEADLFVAPELCITGYLFSSKNELAKLINDSRDSFQKLVVACKNGNCNLILGHASIENKEIYNSAFVINSEGIMGKYNKIHLSKIEKTIFSEGGDIPIFTINNVRVGINICYDLWIPEVSRILFHQKAQLICCPSNFGGSWTLDIARTRSMENKMYYLISNRLGTEKMDEIDAHFRGESKIFDYSGNIISELKSEPGVGIIDIDEELTTSKETTMSNDILYEANKYTVSLRKV